MYVFERERMGRACVGEIIGSKNGRPKRGKRKSKGEQATAQPRTLYTSGKKQKGEGNYKGGVKREEVADPFRPGSRPRLVEEVGGMSRSREKRSANWGDTVKMEGKEEGEREAIKKEVLPPRRRFVAYARQTSYRPFRCRRRPLDDRLSSSRSIPARIEPMSPVSASFVL